MDPINIDLTKYRGVNSTLFTGRPQGEAARLELNLSKLDKEKEKIVLVIPKGTSSFNPSFFLGLLFDSVKELGIEKFEEKYSFNIVDDNPEIKKVIEENIADGKRNALNSILKKNNLSRFFL